MSPKKEYRIISGSSLINNVLSTIRLSTSYQQFLMLVTRNLHLHQLLYCHCFRHSRILAVLVLIVSCIMAELGSILFRPLNGLMFRTFFCLFFSINSTNHQRSPGILFYNIGIGSNNSVSSRGWKLMTFSDILKMCHDDNVRFTQFNFLHVQSKILIFILKDKPCER